MKLLDFVEARKERWDELATLVEAAAGRADRLEATRIMRLGELYRATVGDLARLRLTHPDDPTTRRLERLVGDARGLVYQGSGRRVGVTGFFAETYWRLLWERRRLILLAAATLVVPGFLGALWVAVDRETVLGVMPAGFLWVTEATTTDQGYGSVGLIGFSTFVLVNNIRVTLIAFALGVTWGVGTVWVIAQNGLILGALAALAIDAGNWRLLLAAIAAHGVLELSCIVIGGAAGLAVGRAILRPGTRTRRQALAAEAVPAVQLALGTSAWLVLAGFIEGFASRTGLGWIPTTVMGLVIGVGFWGAMVWRGRPLRRAPAASP